MLGQPERHRHLGHEGWKRIFTSHCRILNAIRMAGRAPHRSLKNGGRVRIGSKTLLRLPQDRLEDPHVNTRLWLGSEPESLQAPFILDPCFNAAVFQDRPEGFRVREFVERGNVDALAVMAGVTFRVRGRGSRRRDTHR